MRSRLRESLQHFDTPRPRQEPAIDPAYIKPDIPLPQTDDEKGNFLPLNTNNPIIEVINIDDNDEDTVVSSTGISSKFLKRSLKRKQKQMFKKMRRLQQNQQSVEGKEPIFIFIDSPESTSVKEENRDASETNIKTENTQNTSVKQEFNDNLSISTMDIKSEAIVDSTVKTERNELIENGEGAEHNGEVRLKVEQESVGGSIQITIKSDSSSETSSVSSLPLSALVKPEPSCTVKSELEASSAEISSTDIKDEAQTESPTEEEKDIKHSITPDTTSSDSLDGITSVISVEEMKVDVSEDSLNVNNNVNEYNDEDMVELDVVGYTEEDRENESEVTAATSKMEIDLSEEDRENESEVTAVTSKMEVDLSEEVDSKLSTDGMPLPNNEPQNSIDNTPEKSDVSQKSVEDNAKSISWAEMKKHNVPLISLQESDDEESEEEGDEVQPLIKPKHCKTTGSVLSALQIFAPYCPQVSEDVPKIKISFDMYLAADFRKSQRGLPQFRIAVFGGSEPVPSPAQLQELQSRFQDRVPVLRAVVTPGSVVFYSCANVSLPILL